MATGNYFKKSSKNCLQKNILLLIYHTQKPNRMTLMSTRILHISDLHIGSGEGEDENFNIIVKYILDKGSDEKMEWEATYHYDHRGPSE